ncbi:hypothetical protein [Adhaeribacter radiodurans]|uniref:Outer membrane protein assembly factor BamE n=1 Tax=Adhaeribacter radiodurans TaxID=2745197 RepID=A0A7L7L6K6_9BACT|nr:hypothetical protein [Adhaeribacter radiodurans]QMU28384.1 hypothetical protein HUW48_10205 [Adhaeribacter radiodurans]
MILSKKLLYHLSFCLIIWTLAGSCRSKVTFPDFDSKAWKNDKYACQSVRNKMIPEVKKITPKLRGLAISQLMGVLGKPDSEALLANNERIYYYYVQPGNQCQNKLELSTANKLLVRFNALEQVSEITFEQPLP